MDSTGEGDSIGVRLSIKKDLRVYTLFKPQGVRERIPETELGKQHILQERF